MEVEFGASAYTVAEGAPQSITVTLNADPERTLIIPIEATGRQDGATAADYSVPPSVTFNGGEMSKSFTFTATQDVIDDDGESVKLGFGTMPDTRVSPGTTDDVTLSIIDDDTAALVVSRASLTLEEGGSSSYTVKRARNSRSRGTTLTNNALTFTSTNWDTAQTVTVMGAHDTDSISDVETLTHTASGGDYAGLVSRLPVTVTDDDTGALRLVDGNFTDENGRLCEGRLEIFYNGAWWANAVGTAN